MNSEALFELLKDPRLEKFEKFHSKNPHVYDLFVKFALKATTKRKRFSARTILHLIRWWTQIQSNDPEGYKVCDHWSPYYARLFYFDYPEYDGFFKMKESAASNLNCEQVYSHKTSANDSGQIKEELWMTV